MDKLSILALLFYLVVCHFSIQSPRKERGWAEFLMLCTLKAGCRWQLLPCSGWACLFVWGFFLVHLWCFGLVLFLTFVLLSVAAILFFFSLILLEIFAISFIWLIVVWRKKVPERGANSPEALIVWTLKWDVLEYFIFWGLFKFDFGWSFCCFVGWLFFFSLEINSSAGLSLEREMLNMLNSVSNHYLVT